MCLFSSQDFSSLDLTENTFTFTPHAAINGVKTRTGFLWLILYSN